ncbi:MAG: hypothetical protein ACOC33_04095 [bacterium]
MTKKSTDFDYSNLSNLTKSMIDELSYFNDPIQVKFDVGNENLVLITGDNATGKSFVRRLYQSVIKLNNTETIHLSQQGRCSSGIPSLLIYGDETHDSTGNNTVNTIFGGINTCKSRNNKHYIIWDEPEIGLSEKYAGGVGVEIKKFVEDLPKLTQGVVIITHSKPLVKQLLPINPSHLRLGNCPNLTEWINKIEEPGDLNELRERNRQTYKAIQSILNQK